MPDDINVLAAEAAAAFPGGVAYTYAAQDALTARILIVEEGGAAFPQGSRIGASDDDTTGKWHSILAAASIEPGMYSWWNAIPCGLGRPATAQDKAKGRTFLNRAIALHTDLCVLIAVGAVAHGVVKAAGVNVKVLNPRSPTRSSKADRERTRAALEEARLYAYPLGLDPDR